MDVVSTYVPRSPEACWRNFTNATLLATWVPGLRRARVVAVGADHHPLEILFEFGESLTYSLRYQHDVAIREVRWEPGSGKRDAVRGFARFDASEAGTLFTYSLEHGGGRSDQMRALGDPPALVAAFARWMLQGKG